MKSETRYDDQTKIIETRLTNDICNDDILDFIDRMIKLTIEKSCYLWIVDYSNARLKLSTLEIYALPEKVYKMMGILGDKKQLVRRALVSRNDISDFIFLENVAKNKGQNLQIFTNRNEAVKWLTDHGI